MSKRILALSPHTDDAEIGAGASIARWLDDGHQIYVYAFSTGDTERGASFLEFAASMAILGIEKYDLGTFVCHYFPRQRQKIIETMIGLRDVWNPDIVLCPSSFDTHQDHEVVHNEAVRAFKMCSTILGYDMPWNHTATVRLDKFIAVTQEQLDRKLDALACYYSQQHRAMSSPEFVTAQAMVRGVQAGMRLAEAFEVIRERE